ncbi:SDR family NAD(P)-dependent oxidoreductase [Agrococcus lahaulensis]|uniref:SDR family NAD(P)-dependent oxidoreductase n=1 Tax=Agrococcus lahaulensis TaxID=341722 RepID=UPI00047A9E9D|nr:SDR family NAD(P)-dependent oxidoreductase [Agrococcus lahaulensis]
MAADLDFTGRTVLITGAATGIGRATALAFGEHGANVVIGDIDDRGAQTAEAIRAAGGKSVFQKTDVTNPEQQESLVALAVSEFGGLDIAFNNAGLLPPTAPLAEQTVEDFRRTLDVDVTGVFLGLKYQLAHMAEQGRGSIINTASVAGLRADPFMAPYVAAKHAVAGLTKAAALDYAAQGIRVNAIAPGLVRSPMTQRWLDDPETRERVLADSPIGRAVEPEEIAGLVLFLAADITTAITGAVYPIDGARTTH